MLSEQNSIKTSVTVIESMRGRLKGSFASKKVGSKADRKIHALGFEMQTTAPFKNICFLLGSCETFVMLSCPLLKKQHSAQIQQIKSCDDV